MGRDFTDADTQLNAPLVTILSSGLVARHFGSDVAIVGRQINLSGDPYLVIGVMPRTFENVLAPSAEAWAPVRYRSHAPFTSAEWGHHLTMFGRIPPGASIDRARQELNAIARTPLPEYPRPSWADLGQGLSVNRLQDDVTRGLKQTLVAIVGAVLLVLAIACVNVANLLLARGARRRGEFAVRAALGAGRARLVRQLLTESLLLAAFGGLLGLAVAEVGVRALVALSPPGLPRVDAIRVDSTVFAFAVAATTLIGLLVGFVPALDASRHDRSLGVQEASRRATGGHHVMRRTLVIAEVALALVLLVGAGLLWRSLSRLFAVAPGFDPSHVLTMQVQEVGHRYGPDPARLQFFEQALEAIRAVPGVRSAAFTSQVPLSGDFESYGVLFESVHNDAPDGDGAAFRYAVTPDYFKTMQIPLRRGRLVDPHDRPGAPQAVVLSESYAKRKFPDRDPIGQRLRLGPATAQPDSPWHVIVGIVGDVKQASLTLGPSDAFYVADGQWWWVDRVQSLVVRTDGDAAALAPDIKRAIWSVDKNLPIVRVTTMADLVATSEAQRHFALSVFQVFGLVALALASIGLYGVISGSVTERRREIGVRSALGASRAMILALVVRQGLRLTGVGVVIGLGGAALASRAIGTLLFGVSRVDPATYLGVVALLAIVSAMACWLPAWRASRVDPVITLRAE